MAKAVVASATELLGDQPVKEANTLKSLIGHGVKATWKEEEIYIDNLNDLPFAIGLSRKSKNII